MLPTSYSQMTGQGPRSSDGRPTSQSAPRPQQQPSQQQQQQQYQSSYAPHDASHFPAADHGPLPENGHHPWGAGQYLSDRVFAPFHATPSGARRDEPSEMRQPPHYPQHPDHARTDAPVTQSLFGSPFDSKPRSALHDPFASSADPSSRLFSHPTSSDMPFSADRGPHRGRGVAETGLLRNMALSRDGQHTYPSSERSLSHGGEPQGSATTSSASSSITSQQQAKPYSNGAGFDGNGPSVWGVSLNGSTPSISSSVAGIYDTASNRSQSSMREKMSSMRPNDPNHHPLRFTWTIFFLKKERTRNEEYGNSLHPIATFASMEDFIGVYQHLKRPSMLASMYDYHLFKQGIKPVWEDPQNVGGGKWIVRLRKGLADRLWEKLICALVADHFDAISNDICGCVISVRHNEDIISVWNQDSTDGRANLKIRDLIKRSLDLPADTVMEYKAHKTALEDGSSFRNAHAFK